MGNVLLPCTPEIQRGKIDWEFEGGFDWKQFSKNFENESYRDYGIELTVRQYSNPESLSVPTEPPAEGSITISFYPDDLKVFSEHQKRLFALPIYERFQERENISLYLKPVPDGHLHPASDGLVLKRSRQFEGRYERVGYYRARALLGKPFLDQGKPKEEVKIV
ncbi:hypothetical protein SLS56_008011 [Neofusicoccum ribis]|uniref:Uncharacterized protein n=1 Tax=Neofusicoccum ribis TaxID=45134 RepID=A0ABR3SLF8_9PEZI